MSTKPQHVSHVTDHSFISLWKVILKWRLGLLDTGEVPGFVWIDLMLQAFLPGLVKYYIPVLKIPENMKLPNCLMWFDLLTMVWRSPLPLVFKTRWSSSSFFFSDLKRPERREIRAGVVIDRLTKPKAGWHPIPGHPHGLLFHQSTFFSPAPEHSGDSGLSSHLWVFLSPDNFIGTAEGFFF